MTLSSSLDVRIPFCESLRYYCARNKSIKKRPGKADECLRYLEWEANLHTQHLGLGQTLSAPADGWCFVYAAAMVFNQYLQVDRKRANFHRII